jgi:hypothetical protein
METLFNPFPAAHLGGIFLAGHFLAGLVDEHLPTCLLQIFSAQMRAYVPLLMSLEGIDVI